MKLQATAVFGFLLLLTSTASANPLVNRLQHEARKSMAHACANAAHSKTGQSRFEVVKLVSKSGRKSYAFWMNTHNNSIGVYCTTTKGEVSSVFIKDEIWKKRNLFRPNPKELSYAD